MNSKSLWFYTFLAHSSKRKNRSEKQIFDIKLFHMAFQKQPLKIFCKNSSSTKHQVDHVVKIFELMWSESLLQIELLGWYFPFLISADEEQPHCRAASSSFFWLFHLDSYNDTPPYLRPQQKDDRNSMHTNFKSICAEDLFKKQLIFRKLLTF